MTTPLIRADTTVNTNVKYSKVFALAFVKIESVTDAFTESDIRAFVLPKLSDPALTGSAIVQLDSVASGENYHSGRGDEAFTGLLTKVFNNGVTDATVTENPSDLAADGVNVYFMTMDGLNETAVNTLLSVIPPIDIEPSISFRTSTAIKNLVDGNYPTASSLTYDSTTVTGGTSVNPTNFTAGGYTIATDTNGKKYLSIADGESFGSFSGGTGNFTLAVVVSAKHIGTNTTNRITYGPSGTLNTYLSIADGSGLAIWPYDYPTTGIATSDYPNYANADYCLMVWSFNKDNNNLTTILRTNTGHSFSNTVDVTSNANSHSPTGTNLSNANTFALVTNDGETGVRIYDMMIFQGEYMTDDRATYPVFGILEDHVSSEYGV